MSGDQSGPLELNGTGGVTPGGDGGSNGALADGTMNGGTASPGGGGGSETGGAGGQGAGDAGCSDGPPSIVGVGPPSPLTGCYLLIVIGEPHSQDHKDIILQRLIKGFLSWDVSDCHVDLEEELNTITLQALEGEEGKHGERLIQYASENLVTEILIHPQINTFIQCIRNLLSSFTRHRHIIHTGYTFAANGSWVLQDGTFSVVDFMEAFQEHEVQRVLRAYPDTITMDVHCAPVGNWGAIQDKSFARLCRIRLNPVDVLSSGSDKLSAFVDYLAGMIVPTEISELLESSDVVGNIRFSHPTLYVFPGGQGDAALFGINGFNMLVDGGFSRKSCFWDFVRHLDRLDAVLMTRINNTNIKGISAVVERKNEAHVYPQIGHFFCNIPERKSLLSPDGDKDRDPLLVDLIEEGHQIVTNLKSLNLKAQNCYRDTEPINLYHKVGHGTLDMYVISPAKDSKEVKEFLAKWHAAEPKLFTPKESKEFTFPIQNIISICALLVWTPANPEDNITRILFPGSAPEYKILEGLEKMKNVEFMRHPLCTVKSIAPSLSTQTITKKSLKSSSIDKIMPEPILPSKVLKPSEKDNKLIDNKMKMIDNKLADAAKSSSEIIDSSGDEAKLEKHVTKSSMATFAAAKVDAGKLKSAKVKSLDSAKKIDNKLIESSKKIDFDEKKDSTSDGGSDKDDTEKKPEEDKEKKEDESAETKKEESPSAKEENKTVKKPGERVSRPATARSRIDTKPPPKVTKTIKKKDETTKSSPTTPKKVVEPKLTNGVSEKKDDEPKKATAPPKTTKPVATKPGKTSPKSTPAKSAKDANNRKVLEARQRPLAKAPVKKEPAAAAEKKESPPKVERKPISRRPKAVAPGHPVGGSPVKAKKVLKSEKDAVIRKAKLDKNGTTDSSLVSTPSADEAGVAVQKRIIDPTASANGSVEGAPEDPMHQQHLAELKEEQDAVREIEAVFKRDSEKAKRHELLSEHREIQDSATEPEEEEEYLIIEKEEQYTEDSINEPESSATKEEEIQKHQRDSEESEKRKRDSLDAEQEEKTDLAKAEGETATVIEVVEGQDKEEAAEEDAAETKPEDKEVIVEKEAVEKVKEEPEAAEKLSPKHKQDLEEEVQDIIASAKEIAKSKMETSMDGLKTEEISSFSPDEKISSTKKTSDTRDENEPEPAPKELIGAPQESHHEERVSATGESGATTTAPTLPEDERIPLDEIKEDLVIEEKHVKEETKEVEVAPPLPTVYEPLERPTPAKMHFSAQQAHMRDVVKTPDEVADLPVHEEADFEEYSEDKDKEAEKERDTKDKTPATEAAAQKKQTEAKQPEKTDKVVVDKSAESDKQCDTVKDVQEEVQEVIEKMEIDTKLDKPPKLETQTSPAKDKLDEAAVLKDLESQIIPTEKEEVKEKVESVATAAKEAEKPAEPAEPAEPEAPEVDDEEDKKSVHEDVIVPTKVEPKVPVPAEPSVLDDIWQAPAKAEEKLEELKHIIDDKAKETTSDLVALKDEMDQELVDRKEQIAETVKTEIAEADKKVKESVAELGKEAEKVALAAADEVVKDVAAKMEGVGEELQSKAQQADEKLAAGVEAIKSDVEQVAAKADQVLDAIATEKKELETLAKEIKEEVSGKLEETKKQLDIELNKAAEQVQEQAKSGISSFFGGITDGIKAGIEKIADKVETKIKDKTEQVEEKLQQVGDKIDELKGKEVVEEVCQKKEEGKVRSFTQELRETHITTLDSPIGDGDKTVEMKAAIKIPQNIDEDKELEEIEDAKQAAAAGSFVIEEVKYSNFEEANLRDIKEEEEEDRVSPPQKDDKKPVSPRLEPLIQPPRSRTPEDVAKIVANVAEVLKSDKDLEEIIPGFDPQELERKLSQGAPREEDVSTVQRMLVTTSSEDGGEEIDICPAGTITFSKSTTPEPTISGKATPEIRVDEEESVPEKKADEKADKPQLPEVKPAEKASPPSSGKSSPDLKTSPTSIEEKEKHELPEKVVADVKKTPEKVAAERKESLSDQFDRIDDSRRESAISTFSERDYTKDESSIVDERDSSRAHSISSHISELNEDEAEPKATDEKQQTAAPGDTAKVETKKSEELSSPESVTSQKTVSEKSVADKTEAPAKDVKADSTLDQVAEKAEPASSEKPAESEKQKDSSRPESAASHTSEKAPSEKSPAAEASRPESAASHVSEKAPSDGKQEPKEASRPESAASAVSAEKPEEKSKTPPQESKDVSRPESVASHVGEKEPASEKPETKEASRPESAASHVSEKAPSEKVEAKEASRPESVASHVSEKASPEKAETKEAARPESVASHVSEKAPSEKAEAKEASRPESAVSHVSEKAPSEKAEEKAASRPESAASHVSEKAPSEKAEVKEASRPESAASHVSEKASPEKAETKEASRPESAASHVSEKAPSEKAEPKEASRPESAASHVSEKAPSEKAEPKDASRPESAASETAQPEKLEVKETSRPESATSAVSDKSPSDKVEVKTEAKEASRPESAASHVSEKATSQKSDEKPTADQEPSRAESAASHVSDKLEPKVESKEEADAADISSRPTSAASHVSEKVPSDKSGDKSPAKEASRPESVASHVSEKLEAEKPGEKTATDKEASRPESAASHVSEKAGSEKPEDKSPVKEASRPESAVSHVSEKLEAEKAEDKPSRPESAASHVSEKDATPKSDDKQDASRPESAASHVSEAKLEEKRESVASLADQKAVSKPAADEKLSEPPKDASRPTSAASDKSMEEKPKTEEVKPAGQVETASAPESAPAASQEEGDKSVSAKDEKKEADRPESAASKASEEKQASRPESAASHVSDKKVEESTKVSPAEDKSVDKAESRAESVASHVSEKSDEKQPSEKADAGKPEPKEDAKETSRPESTASHVSDKEQPKDSEPAAAKTAEAETSRPESAASHATDASKKDEKALSRPESAASHVSDKSPEIKQAEEASAPAKDEPPKEAAKPTEKTPSAAESEKAPSRPESAASHISTKTQESAKDEKETSRPVSVASQKSEKIPSADAEPAQAIVNGDYSRPESPASCSSDKAIPAKEPEPKVAEKDLARQDSTASYHGEPIPDEKSFSRPESPASCGEDQKETAEEAGKPTEDTAKESQESKKDAPAVQEEKPKEEDKDFSRPESPASCGDAKDVPVATTESTVPEKDLARKDSNASYHGEEIPGEKTFSRPDSPASCAEDDAKPASPEKEASRPESAASHPSEKDKSPITTETDASKSPAVEEKPKHDSRPESAASHVSEKSEAKDSQSRRESATKEDRPTSALSDHADEVEDKIVLKESRSKSLSAVMSTPQKIGFDGGALGVLEEVTASRDDLHVLKTPRDSITKLEDLRPTKTESKLDKPLFGPDHFPAEEKAEAKGFPSTGTEKESPDHSAHIVPEMDQLLKETCSSMKEIEKMSTSVISMIKTSEKKEESTKVDEKTSSFPLSDSGKSTPMSTDKDKSQTSSIKSASPHEKDSLEESSVSLNTFIEKDSLSESTTKQVTIKMSAIEESNLKATTSTGGKTESVELLGGTKTPPTAPISPNVVKEDFALGLGQIESTVASSTTMTTTSATTTTSSSQIAKSHKEDASGISTPKESVPSGKSSPGLMSVHTGSTDSASKSINLGHSSGIETSDSSPKPTSPFPKLVDTLKTDDIKTSSGMSTPDMTRTSTPDMVDSQIERIPDDKSMVTTTTTTKTTRYIVKDGEKIEVGTSVKTETSTDAKKDDTSSAGESLSTSSVTTTTTTKIVKEAVKTPATLTLASTEDRSLTEEFDDKDALSPRSDISSGQASRIVAGWHDEDVPGSPMSVTSQAPLSPSTKYTYDYDFQHSSSGVSKKSDIEIDDSQDEIPPQYDSEEVKSAITIASAYKPDPMSTSFYGQLPDVSDTTITTTSATTKSVPIPITAGKAGTKTYMEYASSGDSSSVDSSLHKPTRDSKYLDDADLDFEKTFTKSDQIDLMTTSMHFSSEKEFMAATTTMAAATTAPTTVADSSKKELDFTASGLPSTGSTQQAQTTVTTTAQPSTTTTTTSTTSSTDQSQSDKNKDILASWGKPLGLPSPAPLNDTDMKTTPKKERRMIISKTRLNNEKNLRKRSESPIKPSKKPAPVYVDLSYVPHHGNSYYANVEFFKRVRARYYVFSGTEPSREVYNALLEAKQTWEDKDLEVTIIPTYDTDVLGYWVSENEDLLAKYHIDLSPSAARCTINLQDHETSCSAYRLEF
ncbi:microtubule-associated protein futsch [Sabethes cyaneus]|uniref:microtubule-associated protein futsch n=1 Tax=Sabethes cyaneus TaxID=53552 RepID=UPI00237DC23B|nr:microtubule-associated protein futsch [Sabethes cyaneus]